MSELPEAPQTRIENYLGAIAGGEGELPEAPQTRIETYLAAIAGENVVLPEAPQTRIEQYLEYIAENGGGGGSGDIVLKNLTVTENGVTTAPSGQAYKKVTVSVPQPSGSITLTENGTYDVSAKASAVVAVPIPDPPSGTVDIVANGEVDVTEYASANVHVPQGLPIEVSTAAGMEAVLIAANVGKAYKFTGTTDSTYTQGDIYVVEEG